jgi:hypothetical protein
MHGIAATPHDFGPDLVYDRLGEKVKILVTDPPGSHNLAQAGGGLGKSDMLPM